MEYKTGSFFMIDIEPFADRRRSSMIGPFKDEAKAIAVAGKMNGTEWEVVKFEEVMQSGAMHTVR